MNIRYITGRYPAIFFTLLLAAGFKTVYGQAGVNELEWILRPLALLVQQFSSIEFFLDDGVGYVSRDGAYIIAPACSGFNFMIALHLTLSLGGLAHITRGKSAIVWILVCLPLSWGGTIMINALRVTAAIILFDTEIHYGWLTAERLHRILGVIIFFPCLWCGHQWVASVFNPGISLRRFWNHSLLPLAAYLGILLLIPLLRNPSSALSPSFLDHLIGLVAGCSLVFAVAFLVQSIGKRLHGTGLT